jgi:hypothetical protein
LKDPAIQSIALSDLVLKELNADQRLAA